MSFDSLLNRSCVIVHRTQTGALGRYNAPGWEEIVTAASYNRQQRRGGEDLNEAERQSADFTLFFAIDTAIDGSDVVIDDADGLRLEVIGPPARFTQTAATSHIEVAARTATPQEAS